MANKAVMAVAISPDGLPWEKTVTICTGLNAASEARRWCERKLLDDILGHLFPKNLDKIGWHFSELIRDNGWRIFVSEVDLPDNTN